MIVTLVYGGKPNVTGYKCTELPRENDTIMSPAAWDEGGRQVYYKVAHVIWTPTDPPSVSIMLRTP
jgi:hypothetical protein